LQGQHGGGGAPGAATPTTDVNENSITASKRIFFMGLDSLFFSGNVTARGIDYSPYARLK
jgi:hypothetical protein